MIDQLLGEGSLWKLANHSDPYVRRAVYALLAICMQKRKHALSPPILSSEILTAGLQRSQMGSSLDYIKTIVSLSQSFPDVWTADYNGAGRKSASNRLRYFLRQGSQGGPAQFWDSVPDLLSAIPPELLLSRNREESDKQPGITHDDSTLVIIEALRDGVTRKEEPRTSSGAAWTAYLSTCAHAICSFDGEAKLRFLQTHVVPIIRQYVKPSGDTSQWSVTGVQQQRICAKAVHLILHHDAAAFKAEWQMLSSQLIEDLQTSLPEQSKEYTRSQDSVANEASRWYRLQATILDDDSSVAALVVKHTTLLEIQAAISALKNRNGKPYAAAVALHVAAESIPGVILGQETSRIHLVKFANDDLPNLMSSPSATYLIRLLDLIHEDADVTKAYVDCNRTLEGLPDAETRNTTIETLFASPGFGKSGGLSTSNTILQGAIDRAIEEDSNACWNIVMAVIGNVGAPIGTTDDILTSMIEGLVVDEEDRASLHGLELMLNQNQSLMRDFAVRPEGSVLLSRVLSKTESSDPEISLRAQKLSVHIEKALATTGNAVDTVQPLIDVVRRELGAPGLESLPVASLVSQAQKIIRQIDQTRIPRILAELLPNTSQWAAALSPFIHTVPNVSISLCRPFGGANSLLHTVSGSNTMGHSGHASIDRTGRTQLLRLADYVVELLQITDVLEVLETGLTSTLLEYITLAVLLAGDNISIGGSVPVFYADTPDKEADIVASVSDAQSSVISWTGAPTMSLAVSEVMSRFLSRANGFEASAYYNARAFSFIAAALSDRGERVPIANESDRLKVLRKSPDVFANLAMLLSVEHRDALKACNELLSQLTAVAFGSSAPEPSALSQLVLLNGLLRRSDELVSDIPQQRLVFYVQHIVKALPSASRQELAEMLRSLAIILPSIKEIYGSFWANTLDSLRSEDGNDFSDANLPKIHGSLRLFSILKKPTMQEGNDDLLDAWTEQRSSIAAYEIQLLLGLQYLEDHSHQPRRIVNELLCREISSLDYDLDDPSALYPVLTSKSHSLQIAAFNLLHKHVPSRQEQKSLDKALTKDYQAQLPEELLSLVLTAPSMPELSESLFDRSMPSHLQSYLLSWLVIFDHWTGASNMLQMDYAKSLSEGTYLNDLLDMTFKILISSRSKPIDATKFSAETYVPDTEPPERDTHWLLIHLYYLCLKCVPTQTKTWWRDSTSRQVNVAVATWTEKSLSRLIIDTELAAIREWAPSQQADEHPMTIKVSHSAHEITASIPVDEQTMVLAIRMPPSYPLARAEVEGVHRVGVPEKKWMSWIRNAQGQLTIASEGGGNALIDCLVAWRKNVTATMKGQSECAICYSVVGADRTLPSKVCKTCKNKFHGSCLFRWFSSSNSSSCPLCRNTFTYS